MMKTFVFRVEASFQALIKHLKKNPFDIPWLLTTSLCKQSLTQQLLPALPPALAGRRKRSRKRTSPKTPAVT